MNVHSQNIIGSSIIASSNDLFGYSVGINSDGSKFAAGSPYNSSASINGYGSVYQNISSAWSLYGTSQQGEALNDNFGIVAYSSNGDRLAVGGYTNDGNGADSGHVRVFDWNGSAWVQLGTDINGEAADDNSGRSVALNSDGTVLAIGAPLNDGNGANSGHVRVYAWNGSAWVQRGVDLNGEAAGDEFGCAVSLSSNGNTLAIGGNKNDGAGVDAGHVRVYYWNGASWGMTGGEINGGVAGDGVGSSLSISNDGYTLAVGAPFTDNGSNTNTGRVRVYYNGGAGWTQRGWNLTGSQTGSNFGFSVSLSGSGNVVVVGEPGYDASVTNANRGRFHCFQYDNTNYTNIGVTITGSLNAEQMGYSVAISNDGTKVAVGSPGSNAGRVRMYNISNILLSNTSFTLNNKFSLYPNPSNNFFSIDYENQLEKVEIYNLQGQLVKSFSQMEQYNVSDLSAGIYSVIVHAEEGKGVKKLIKQ